MLVYSGVSLIAYPMLSLPAFGSGLIEART